MGARPNPIYDAVSYNCTYGRDGHEPQDSNSDCAKHRFQPLAGHGRRGTRWDGDGGIHCCRPSQQCKRRGSREAGDRASNRTTSGLPLEPIASANTCIGEGEPSRLNVTTLRGTFLNLQAMGLSGFAISVSAFLDGLENLAPVLVIQLGRQVFQDGGRTAHRYQQAMGGMAKCVGNAAPLNDALKAPGDRDGGATLEIAPAADRNDLQWLVVVAVLVFDRGSATVIAIEMRRVLQATFADCDSNHAAGLILTAPCDGFGSWVSVSGLLAQSAAEMSADAADHFDGLADRAAATHQATGFATGPSHG